MRALLCSGWCESPPRCSAHIRSIASARVRHGRVPQRLPDALHLVDEKAGARHVRPVAAGAVRPLLPEEVDVVPVRVGVASAGVLAVADHVAHTAVHTNHSRCRSSIVPAAASARRCRSWAARPAAGGWRSGARRASCGPRRCGRPRGAPARPRRAPACSTGARRRRSAVTMRAASSVRTLCRVNRRRADRLRDPSASNRRTSGGATRDTRRTRTPRNGRPSIRREPDFPWISPRTKLN